MSGDAEPSVPVWGDPELDALLDECRREIAAFIKSNESEIYMAMMRIAERSQRDDPRLFMQAALWMSMVMHVRTQEVDWQRAGLM